MLVSSNNKYNFFAPLLGRIEPRNKEYFDQFIQCIQAVINDRQTTIIIGHIEYSQDGSTCDILIKHAGLTMTVGLHWTGTQYDIVCIHVHSLLKFTQRIVNISAEGFVDALLAIKILSK
jgi:hypothetical protein